MSNPSFGHDTTGEEVASFYASNIKDKTILITGVSPGGIGLETAKILSVHSPHLIILAARSPHALAAAEAELKLAAPTCAIKQLQLDLGSIRSVRNAAGEVLGWQDVPKIDILINNAGVMNTPWGKSEDGIETQFATNHIGHWLFTNLLVPKVAAAKGRIVMVASLGHTYGAVRFEDWNFKDGKEYDPDAAYGQSKTANILAAIALASKLKAKGITAFSLHPGLIMTNLPRHVSMDIFKERGFIDEDGNILVPSKSLSQGTSTTLTAALDPTIAGRSGAYLVDCKIDHEGPWAEHAKGEENAEKLWALSEQLVGQKFAW